MIVHEYIRNAHQTFAEKPFNDIDSMVLTQVLYAKIEAQLDAKGIDRTNPGLSIRDYFYAEYFDDMFNDGIADEENLQLYAIISASRRYRDIKIKHVAAISDPVEELQFAAATFEIDEQTDYVCFRGTDGSMFGWKEDLKMAFNEEIPSQASAVRYLNKHYGEKADSPATKLILGGHSKGGNLAVYASFMADDTVRSKLVEVHSFDGPGFKNTVIERFNEIGSACEIVQYVPQTSIVGMMLASTGERVVVKSKASGINQHAAFTWEIENDEFVKLEKTDSQSLFFDRTISDWIMKASEDEREQFVEVLFDLVRECGVETVNDLKELPASKYMEVYKIYTKLDAENKAIVSEMFQSLFKSAVWAAFPEKLRTENSEKLWSSDKKSKKEK